MRAVVQRVKSAGVSIENKTVSQIEKGILVLVGITQSDTKKDMEYIVNKCLGLRIFEDENGVMNKSLEDIKGELLLVSQFTLMGDARHGRRPSYIKAEAPSSAVKKYEELTELFKEKYGEIKTGVFGADMQVTLVNDGPVTILLDSEKIF